MKTRHSHRQTAVAKTFSPLEYIAKIYRGRWIIAVSVAIVMGASVIQALIGEKVYQATSSILIDTRQARGLQFLDATTASVQVNTLQNEMEILKSSALAGAVAEKLIQQKYLDPQRQTPIHILRAPAGKTPDDSVQSVKRVVLRLQGVVDFETVRQSDVIKITAKSNDPDEAALIANLYAESYYEANVYASRSRSRMLRVFLEDQRKEQQASLQVAENSLQQYMQKEGVVSLDEESKKVIGQLSVLEAERNAVDIELKSLAQTFESYNEQIARQEQDVGKVMGQANDPYIRRMQEQLAQLEVQLDVTVAQNPRSVDKELYNDKVTSVREQIAALRAKLQQRTDEFLKTILPSEGGGEQNDPAGYLKQIKEKMLQTHMQIQALQAKRGALTKVVEDYDRQFRQIPEKSMDFARLQRQKMGLEKLYTTLDEKYSEASISEQSQFGYINIFDHAVPPQDPSSPKLFLNTVLGLILGFGLGICIVVVRDLFQKLIEKPEDLERFELTLLATIMDLRPEILRFNGQKKVLVNSKAIDVQLVMASNPLSPLAEPYRHLCATLHIPGREHQPRTILLTSPTMGEGKSTTISNLALAFAEAGKSVLLLETDLRRPAIHAAFDLPGEPGLAELLAGKADSKEVIQTTMVPNLHVISSGSLSAEPRKLLGSEHMKALLQEMKRKYDVVLLDCPPVLAITDALVLSPMIDVVAMVVSAGKTDTVTLQRALDALETVGVKTSGIILNNFDLRRAYGITDERHSAGYYGYGYGYHSSGERESVREG